MSNRANEYSLLIFEILEDDARLRAKGLPSLACYEINELRAMVNDAIEQIENKIEKRKTSS